MFSDLKVITKTNDCANLSELQWQFIMSKKNKFKKFVETMHRLKRGLRFDLSVQDLTHRSLQTCKKLPITT